MTSRGKDGAVRGKTAVGVKNRIYFLGEIFWTERERWTNTPFGKNPAKPFRAAMVTLKSQGTDPVLMIPGSSQYSDDENSFTPEKISNNSSETGIIGSYHLDYARIIDRWHISFHIGTISTKDKQKLADRIAKYSMKNGDTK